MAGNTKRPRLGRGLASLIRSSAEPTGPEVQPEPAPEADAEAGQYAHVEAPEALAVAAETGAAEEAASPPAGAAVMMLPLGSIRRNPYQPRREFDEPELSALADSIRSHGVLQPVLVGEAGVVDGQTCYELIAGERRLRAAELAGAAELPAIVRRSTPEEMLELALVENIHRSDLNPLERASAYRELMDRFSLTQQQVAERVGEPRPTVANYLRLLDMADEVQRLIGAGELSFGHGKILAGLAGRPEAQTTLARRAVTEGLSVRELEALVAAAATGAEAAEGERASAKAKAPMGKSAYLLDLERQLTEAVGTRVQIRPGRAKHSGRIVIEYHDLDGFDRIAAALGAALES